MKMLYFMNASDGSFNSDTSTAPDAVCYPLSSLKGLASKTSTGFQIDFDSAQAAGTDEANNTSGLDVISFTISTADNHKANFRKFVELFNKHVARDNGLVVVADTANGITMSDDVSSTFTILTDNPA